jgi:hypothetical protein
MMIYPMRWIGCLILLSLSEMLVAQAGQINIQRIESMPNEPSPYFMRDWKAVAQGYDSLVYDITKSGQYLPLVFIRANGTNYPDRGSFGLDSYVGTNSNDNGEAINVMPSLVSASLVGVDKRNQFGQDWILMSQDYFNAANGENLYLNNIGGHSGNDWWYDMLPNIYFYELYDLYGPVGDAESQYHLIADRMYDAVKAMGGKATPWTKANMDYRAWDFLHMTPNPDGVHEPEAAGAYAWLLYHAYQKTGDVKYLQGAEWSMEFLNNLASNPAYELQLPFGAYIAARMNAEIGTKYLDENFLYWIFNRGPLRGWGTIVGNWNTFDASGLVGEANDAGNDYAFQLNGVQQAAQLAPLVRYDKRFARAIGKWLLNVANATRLMYPGFLPTSMQDASAWSAANDPQGVMGYEALREVWNGMSPVSTGDALKGGWAGTNLSLYSTSSIGYLGAILETTNQEKILKIDLLKTDFFHDAAYPSYLYFNPYNAAKSVTLDVGTEAKDIYDALTQTFLATNVSGITTLTIPANQAISIVLAPANGTISFDKNKMLIDGVVVDYKQTQQAYNYPPRIQAFATESNTVEKNKIITFYAKGIDQETKDLTYTFFFPDDTISGLAKTATWTTPNTTGSYSMKLVATDEAGLTDTAFLQIEVVPEINISPVINNLVAGSRYTQPNWAITLAADVTDANNDPITYAWSSTGGFISGTGSNVTWYAPANEGIFTIQLQVNDGRGGTSSASVTLLVIDLSQHTDGNLIAWYPFNGNALDFSGNQLNGLVSGAKLTTDSLGQPQAAYFFDGINDHIRVTNAPVLNFGDGISVTGFVKPGTIGDKERFIISHGSWQNRWKISITPTGKLRWTLKNTTGGVKDLDSETTLEEAHQYHVACTYDGKFMEIYINGRLESFTTFSGTLNPSPVDLEIAQIMPDDPAYNFGGVLDEIKIFDYALLPDSVFSESGQVSTGMAEHNSSADYGLNIYPNPAHEAITLEFTNTTTAQHFSNATYHFFNMAGQEKGQGRLSNALNQTIPLSGLLPGCYVLNIFQGGQQVSKTIWIN